ncbi:MAG: peptidylprolyl isomerase [Candidatus Zixiibacteriota bacterium]|nr:MAG: peptidylprolyl isomerase [candidate division Zixibacteria bacterium]
MFEFLRKLIFPIIIIVLIFFTGMIVLQWGADITRSRTASNVIGVINGEEVPWTVFDRYYNSLVREEQDKIDYELPSSRLVELRDQAWQQLLVDYLIRQEVARYKITVTDEEVFGFLRVYPPAELQTAQQFLTDGKFDQQKYAAAMINPDNAPFWASVEQYVMPDLKRYKLQEEIVSTVRITPAEVMQAFLGEREELKLGYIYISRNELNSIVDDPTEEEIQAFYDENMEDYKIGKRAVIRIVHFNKEPSQNDWDRIYVQAKEIYDSAAAGSDFAELARIWSEDASAASGGDLDWFERGRMLPAFDSAVWALEVEQISPPVRTKHGWHIIKLLGIKTERKAPQAGGQPQDVEMRNAAHILLKVNASQETFDQLEFNAKDFAETAKENGFDETAERFEYIPLITPPFQREDYIQSIGVDPEVADFALNKPVGTISDVSESRNSYFVFTVSEHLPAGYKSFETVKSPIKSRLRGDRVRQVALDTAGTIHTALSEGMKLSQASRQFGFPYAVKDKITRNSIIPNLGKEPELLAAAFSLKEINQLSQPVAFRNGVTIFKLLEKNSPSLDEYEQIQDSLQAAVLLKKQQDVYQRWFENLMQGAEIENYVDEFYRGGY